MLPNFGTYFFVKLFSKNSSIPTLNAALSFGRVEDDKLENDDNDENSSDDDQVEEGGSVFL